MIHRKQRILLVDDAARQSAHEETAIAKPISIANLAKRIDERLGELSRAHEERKIVPRSTTVRHSP